MKKLLLLLFLVSNVVLVNAATKKIKGTIIRGKIRKSVTFDVPFYEGSIDHVKVKRGLVYYRSGKKTKLKPKDVDRIELDMDGKIISLIPLKLLTVLGNKVYFLQPYAEGKISYYILELSHGSYRDGSGNITSVGFGVKSDSQTASYLVKKGEGLKGYTRKNVQRFISDCPYVLEKLGGKNWWDTDIDLLDLLADYNNNCDE